MRFSLKTAVLAVGLSSALGVVSTAWAQKGASTQAPANGFVDGIAAVVNDDVITLRQVQGQLEPLVAQLKHQNVPMPDMETMRRQVLQRMIMERLEEQEARALGIRVSDANVLEALQVIAQRNNFTEQQLRAEVERNGVRWEDYMVTLRQEIMQDQLRMRVVDSTINITDGDIDAFLRTEGRQQGIAALGGGGATAAPTAELALAQILLRVPESASAAEEQAIHQKAQQLLQQLRSGADFAGLAVAQSEGQEALRGGVLGVRTAEEWPDLFVQATRSLNPGQVSDLVRSGQGYHILKVLDSVGGTQNVEPRLADAQSKQGDQSMMVTQTHARHILVKLSQVMDDAQAEQRIRQLQQRIAHGESFEDLAKRYSEDSSAPQGGDLGWLSPGETVPSFEQAMDKLQDGQVGEPVKSQFGWHLIQVIERRTRNMENEYRRSQARQILFQRRAEPAFEDWLNGVRGKAYIDNRLEKSSSAE